MRIYFSQLVKHEDGSKPVLKRSAYGSGFSRGYSELSVLFRELWFLIHRAFVQGYLCHLSSKDGEPVAKRISSVRFVITLKF